MDKTTTNFFEDGPVIYKGVGSGLSIVLNTAQTGRVFQDRSLIKAEYRGKTIWNLGFWASGATLCRHTLRLFDYKAQLQNKESKIKTMEHET